jgi:hypothetical protein
MASWHASMTAQQLHLRSPTNADSRELHDAHLHSVRMVLDDNTSCLSGGAAEVGGELHVVGVEQLKVAAALYAVLEHQLDAFRCWVLVLEGTAGKHFIMHADGCLHQ